ADAGASGFMDRRPPDPDATIDGPIGESPGAGIGPYTPMSAIAANKQPADFIIDKVGDVYYDAFHNRAWTGWLPVVAPAGRTQISTIAVNGVTGVFILNSAGQATSASPGRSAQNLVTAPTSVHGPKESTGSRCPDPFGRAGDQAGQKQRGVTNVSSVCEGPKV